MKKILVGEPSSLIQKTIKSALNNLEVEIDFADSEKSFTEYYINNKYHLISLATNMNDVSGFELATKLKISRVPFIFITANDDIELRLKGFAIGATHFLKKSELKDKLAELASSLLFPSQKYGGFNVLIVDDSKIIIASLVNSLLPTGVNVIKAHNGIEALNIIKKNVDNIDIIITDLKMPEMDGSELCTRVRHELEYDLPIIFLSSEGSIKERLRMFRAGATDYLLKPFTGEELRARVYVYLDRLIRQKDIETLTEQLKINNSTLSSFASRAAHDLKAPLRNISAFIEIITDDPTRSKEDIERYKNIILESSNNMNSLIEDLLKYARNANVALSTEFVKLNEIVDNAILNIKAYQEEYKAVINVAELPNLKLDKRLLVQVFQNIILNAIKYSKPNVSPIIKVVPDENNKDVTFHKIDITDNGRGFDNSLTKKLFMPFERGVNNSEVKGSGLGLALCKEIVEKHGGKIEVDSLIDQGTTFSIFLPKTLSNNL